MVVVELESVVGAGAEGVVVVELELDPLPWSVAVVVVELGAGAGAEGVVVVELELDPLPWSVAVVVVELAGGVVSGGVVVVELVVLEEDCPYTWVKADSEMKAAATRLEAIIFFIRVMFTLSPVHLPWGVTLPSRQPGGAGMAKLGKPLSVGTSLTNGPLRSQL